MVRCCSLVFLLNIAWISLSIAQQVRLQPPPSAHIDTYLLQEDFGEEDATGARSLSSPFIRPSLPTPLSLDLARPVHTGAASITSTGILAVIGFTEPSSYRQSTDPDEDGPNREETTQFVGGLGAYVAGGVGAYYLSKRIMPRDTSSTWKPIARVALIHTAGSIAAGTAVHLFGRRKGNFPQAVGGAFLASPIILLGSGLVGLPFYLVGLESVAEAIGMAGGMIAVLGLPGVSTFGAMEMDMRTRGR